MCPPGRSTTTCVSRSTPHLTIVMAALAVSKWVETTTGWSIRKFVRTARRYRTFSIQAGDHTITADALVGSARAASMASSITPRVNAWDVRSRRRAGVGSHCGARPGAWRARSPTAGRFAPQARAPAGARPGHGRTSTCRPPAASAVDTARPVDRSRLDQFAAENAGGTGHVARKPRHVLLREQRLQRPPPHHPGLVRQAEDVVHPACGPRGGPGPASQRDFRTAQHGPCAGEQLLPGGGPWRQLVSSSKVAAKQTARRFMPVLQRLGLSSRA